MPITVPLQEKCKQSEECIVYPLKVGASQPGEPGEIFHIIPPPECRLMLVASVKSNDEPSEAPNSTLLNKKLATVLSMAFVCDSLFSSSLNLINFFSSMRKYGH